MMQTIQLVLAIMQTFNILFATDKWNRGELNPMISGLESDTLAPREPVPLLYFQGSLRKSQGAFSVSYLRSIHNISLRKLRARKKTLKFSTKQANHQQ